MDFNLVRRWSVKGTFFSLSFQHSTCDRKEKTSLSTCRRKRHVPCQNFKSTFKSLKVFFNFEFSKALCTTWLIAQIRNVTDLVFNNDGTLGAILTPINAYYILGKWVLHRFKTSEIDINN